MDNLKGIYFPATKDDLLDRARENDAPEDVMKILRQMPDKRFGGPQEILKAYGDVE